MLGSQNAVVTTQLRGLAVLHLIQYLTSIRWDVAPGYAVCCPDQPVVNGIQLAADWCVGRALHPAIFSTAKAVTVLSLLQ